MLRKTEISRPAHLHGCPWDECTFVGAEQRGFTEIVEWAISQGCPYGEEEEIEGDESNEDTDMEADEEFDDLF